MKILCVHGVGHEDAHIGQWQPIWSQVIQHELTLDGGPIPTIRFVAYDDLVEGVFARVGPSLLATEIALLVAGGLAGPYLAGMNADDIQWTAGMVAVWILSPTLRQAMRDRLRQAIEDEQPDLIIAHSLGSDLVYDLMTREPDLFNDKVLVTAGSQIGNPVARQVFTTAVEPQDSLAQWFHLYNSNDHVFTAPLDGDDFKNADNFIQIETDWNTSILTITGNHDMVPGEYNPTGNAYLTHPNSIAYLWPYLRDLNRVIADGDLLGRKTSDLGFGFFGGNNVASIKPWAKMYFDDGRLGFSETYWHKPGPTLPVVLLDADALAQKRRFLFGVGISLDKIEVGDAAVVRAVEKGYPGYLPDPRSNNGSADNTFKSLFAEAQGAISGPTPDGVYNDKRYFAGIPDSVITTPAPSLTGFPAPFRANWANFCKELCNGNWVYWPYDRNPATSPKVEIAKIVNDGSHAMITTKAPHHLAAGDGVRISGTHTIGNLGTIDGQYGPYEWTFIDATTFAVVSGLASGIVWSKLGKMHRQTQVAIPYLALTYQNFVRRKRGTGWVRQSGKQKSKK